MSEDLQARLDVSVAQRAAMLSRFGFIPGSVLRLHRGALSRSMFNYLGERPGGSMAPLSSILHEEGAVTDTAKATARERRERGLLGGVRGVLPRDRQSVSIMAAELVDFCIKFYAEAGQTYLDPFSAQGIQLQIAVLRGMHYLGSDICHEYVEYQRNLLPKLKLDDDQRVSLHEGDSRDASWLDDGCGDFSFTSPPYWDIEYYGPEQGQLGTNKSYDDFLQGMFDVAAAWLPKYRSGAWVLVNVGDIKRDKRLIPYHAHTIELYQRAGYELRDIWIVEGLIAGLTKAFAVSIVNRKVVPKQHEYLLAFQVP